MSPSSFPPLLVSYEVCIHVILSIFLTNPKEVASPYPCLWYTTLLKWESFSWFESPVYQLWSSSESRMSANTSVNAALWLHPWHGLQSQPMMLQWRTCQGTNINTWNPSSWSCSWHMPPNHQPNIDHYKTSCSLSAHNSLTIHNFFLQPNIY